MQPVLHVGFHKSGSTTVQGALFARHPQIASLGEPNEDPIAFAAIRGVADSVHRSERKRVPFEPERCQALWQQAMAAVPEGKVPLFSKESLTQYEHYDTPADRRMAERLRMVVGPARIIIVVRHQIKLIESLYLFHSKGARYEAPEQWLRARNDGPLRMYSYHLMTQPFVENFGRENVAIIPFEQLKHDPAGFAARICNFIGVDAERGTELMQRERRNQRISNRYLLYSKLRKASGLYIRLGHLVPPSVRDVFNGFLMGGGEAKIKLPSDWVKETEHYYREDNRRLAAEWRLPLEQYGYPL